MSKIMPLQDIVYLNVGQRGYLSGYTQTQIIQRQLIKAVEKMGEVAAYIFDGDPPPLDELADVIIPLLIVAAETGQGDLLSAILAKSTADVKRGKRNEKD